MINLSWWGWLLAGTFGIYQAQSSIPAHFQGEWNSNRSDCGVASGESRLKIEAQALWFYESGGPVRAIVTQGQTDLAVILELSGEGETWLEFYHYRLSQDQQTLTDITAPSSPFKRYRCPPLSGLI